jgi:hypothetical protein
VGADRKCADRAGADLVAGAERTDGAEPREGEIVRAGAERTADGARFEATLAGRTAVDFERFDEDLLGAMTFFDALRPEEGVSRTASSPVDLDLRDAG